MNNTPLKYCRDFLQFKRPTPFIHCINLAKLCACGLINYCKPIDVTVRAIWPFCGGEYGLY